MLGEALVDIDNVDLSLRGGGDRVQCSIERLRLHSSIEVSDTARPAAIVTHG